MTRVKYIMIGVNCLAVAWCLVAAAVIVEIIMRSVL